MNKTQLIDALSTRYEGNRKQAQHALESVLDTITREVARGEKVAITGFGSFEKRVREARWVRNPRTGDRIKAKKTAVPKFTAGAELKAFVSGSKKLPKLPKASDVAKAASAPARAAAGAAKKASGTSTAKKAAGEVDGVEVDDGQEGAGEVDRFEVDDGQEGAGEVHGVEVDRFEVDDGQEGAGEVHGVEVDRFEVDDGEEVERVQVDGVEVDDGEEGAGREDLGCEEGPGQQVDGQEVDGEEVDRQEVLSTHLTRGRPGGRSLVMCRCARRCRQVSPGRVPPR